MLGKCPYCGDGVIEMEKKQVRGAMTKIYSCSNVKIVTGDIVETVTLSRCMK